MRNVRFAWAVGIAVSVLLLTVQPVAAQGCVSDDAGNCVASEPALPGFGFGSSLPERNAPDGYGISGWGVHTTDCHAFHGYNGADYTSWAGGYCGANTGTWNYFDVGVQLPSGALVYGMTPYYYDNDAGAGINYFLFRTKRDGATFTSDTLWTHNSTGTPAIYAVYEALATPYVWKNSDIPAGQIWTYWLRARDGSLGDSTTGFGGVSIWYKLQITPAPGSATFSDVPVGAFGFQHIEALVASGITAGCGGGNFCPNDPLTRVQMAIFLAKALGLHWPDA
jgi:hypothetical protein